MQIPISECLKYTKESNHLGKCKKQIKSNNLKSLTKYN